MMTKIKLLTTKEINAVIEQIELIKGTAEYEEFWSNFDLQYENFPRHELGATSTKFYSMIEEKVSEAQLAEFLSKRLLVSRAQAADPQFWITLNFIYFSEFIRSLYDEKSDDIDKLKSNLKSHFIQTSSQGSLLKGPISGLWWAAKITVLPMHDYTYTYKFLKHRNLRFKNLGSHQIIRHQPALLALLDFLDDNSELKVQSTGNLLGAEAIAQAMSKALNQIAGTRLISVFNQDEIRGILEKYKSYIIKLAIDIHKGKRGITEEEFYELEDTKTEIIDEDQGSQVVNESTEKPIEEPQPKAVPDVLPTVVGKGNVDKGDADFQIDRYFLYNKYSRQYKISKYDNEDFDIRISFSSKRKDQILLHFYKEGKINRTFIGSNILSRNLDQLYQNGANKKLTLLDIILVPPTFYIAIAYKYRNKIYFKIYEDQILRDDNESLLNEGKKLIYPGDIQSVAYKILPRELDEIILKSFLFDSPTTRGRELFNSYNDAGWNALKKYWPELYSKTLFED